MKDGKLSEVAFKRSVLPAVNRINAGKGRDLCMRTAVVSGNEEGVAKLAVARAINALAAVPAEALQIAVNISLPHSFPEDCHRFSHGAAPEETENAVKSIMAEVEEAIGDKAITIGDIAAEVTGSGLITVSVTAYGKPTVLRAPGRKNLAMAGLTGAAGSGMLSINHRDELLTRYTADFLEGSDRLFSDIDISRKVSAAVSAEGYKTCIEAVSDGGVFGAIWSLCDRLQCGCEIDIKNVPIKQATVEVGEFFDINPYMLRGDGAFIYVTEKEAGELTEGVIIGRLTSGSDRVIINGETRSFLTPVREDSYFEIHSDRKDR